MQRVMIVGQPGSGKSTLARKLGQRTGLPVVHIDTIHWQPGWIERNRDEKTRLCLEVEARECWIFEGGHSATWENRMARADLLIWIDRWRRFDSYAYCSERCFNAANRGLTCRRTALNCWRTCRSFSGSCGGRKNQREQRCSNSWQLRHQRAAWFICGPIGIPGIFSQALNVRLKRAARD